MAKNAKPARDLLSRASKRAYQSWKHAYQFIRWRPDCHKAILFIVGCQRSGTTLMQEIFERELNATVYGEFSELSSMDHVQGIRLNPLEIVKSVIEHDRAPLIVLKPLVETQNILKLLHFFPESRALFLYRHYRDVALSIVKKFGAESPIQGVHAVVTNQAGNWRSEEVSEHVRNTLAAHFSSDMNPLDAAALRWWARNSLYFDLDLNNNRAVMLCKYEELARNPARAMSRIYGFTGVGFQVGSNIRQVHSDAVSKGKGIVLSRDIDILCSELLARLDGQYSRQEAAGAQRANASES